MITLDFELKGLKEIQARLIELDALAGQKMVKHAVRRSLIQLERSASANAGALSKSGALREAIRITNVKPKGDEIVAVQVGPKRKDRRAIAVHNVYYRRKLKGIFYGHLVEFGHRIGTRSTGWLRKGNKTAGKGGTSAGKVDGRPFFTPAWNATRAGILPEFQRLIALGLKRLEKRKAKEAKTEGLVDP